MERCGGCGGMPAGATAWLHGRCSGHGPCVRGGPPSTMRFDNRHAHVVSRRQAHRQARGDPTLSIFYICCVPPRSAASGRTAINLPTLSTSFACDCFVSRTAPQQQPEYRGRSFVAPLRYTPTLARGCSGGPEWPGGVDGRRDGVRREGPSRDVASPACIYPGPHRWRGLDRRAGQGPGGRVRGLVRGVASESTPLPAGEERGRGKRASGCLGGWESDEQVLFQQIKTSVVGGLHAYSLGPVRA